MQTKLLYKDSFLLVIALFLPVFSQTCDTTKDLLGNTLVTCLNSNCPIDSTRVEYENGNLRRTHIYFACKDSGIFLYFNNNGDTLTKSFFKGKKKIGISKQFFSSNHPKRFITYNDSGEKHGWEVFWYENGNVKDSTLFRNDSTMQGKSFYFNGKLSYEQNDIYSTSGYNASSYNPQGKKTGQVKNGTGTVFTCDSLGGNCHELQFKDGKRVFK